ncbi:MAG: site-specific integrase [Candidatus Methanomethylophilaceae archaeon]|nr:site-specific integrase [Candidatus Methanomethylophilaceae archaeon]
MNPCGPSNDNEGRCGRIDAFLDALYGDVKPSRYYKQREALLEMDGLMDHRIELSPLDIGVKDVRDAFARLGPLFYGLRKEDLLGYLDEYLVFHGNSVVRDTMGGLLPRERGHVAYLNEAEYLALMDVPKNPVQDVVIRLEACCGLRISECCELKLRDLHLDPQRPYILVRGNRVRDDRVVALDAGTIRAITRWMLQRPDVVKNIRLRHSGWEDPGTLLLRTDSRNQSWKGGEWDSSSLNYDVLDPLDGALRFPIWNQLLRATFARRALESGRSVGEVTRALGFRTDCWTRTWGLDVHEIALQRAIRARGAGPKGGSA